MVRTVFTNVNLLDGIHAAQANATVIVEGNRITGVQNGASDLPRGEPVIDLSGMTLMPGMISGHGHLQWVNLAEHSLIGHIFTGAERPPAVAAIGALRTCERLMAAGITMVAGAGCGYDIDASLKIARADGLIAGPRILASGRHVNTTGNDNYLTRWWYDLGNMGLETFADGPDGIVHLVRTCISRGAEIIKLYPTSGHGVRAGRKTLTDAELDAAVGVAHDLGCKVRAHVVGRDETLWCVKAGVDLIDHADGLDEQCIDEMVKHGTFWVPSPMLLKLLGEHHGMGDLPPGTEAEHFPNQCKMVPIANRAGVKIVPGDDYGLPILTNNPGDLAKELTLYVEEMGVDPIDVLRWATYHGGLLMDEKCGRIEAGWLADLVVVRGDPSADIRLLENPASNIAAVMIDGGFVKNELPGASVSSPLPATA